MDEAKKIAYSTCWDPDTPHGDAYGTKEAPEHGDAYLNMYNYDTCCWEGEPDNKVGVGAETCWSPPTKITGGPLESEGLEYSFEECCKKKWHLVDCKLTKEQMEDHIKRKTEKGLTCDDVFGKANGGEGCKAMCRSFFPNGLGRS